jgi:1-acyl-sn-glycerol-3-phosphate acyltransferase
MIAALDRFWRLISTAICFALFGLGGLALALTVFPLLNILVRDKHRRAAMAQDVVHATMRLYRLVICSPLGPVSCDCPDAAILRAERGCLVVANHPTLLDIVFLMSVMERTQCVVKAGVWRNPFMRGVVTAANYIPNLDDPEKLLDDCAAALKAGNNLVIFPEGSRTPPGRKRKYQRGFAYVALRSGAPIRIVTLTCDPPTLFKGEPWHKIPVRRARWVIRVHERLDPVAHEDQPAIAVRRLCAQVERRIEDSLAA